LFPGASSLVWSLDFDGGSDGNSCDGKKQ